MRRYYRCEEEKIWEMSTHLLCLYRCEAQNIWDATMRGKKAWIKKYIYIYIYEGQQHMRRNYIYKGMKNMMKNIMKNMMENMRRKCTYETGKIMRKIWKMRTTRIIPPPDIHIRVSYSWSPQIYSCVSYVFCPLCIFTLFPPHIYSGVSYIMCLTSVVAKQTGRPYVSYLSHFWSPSYL